jgi:hypothetical protein
MRRINPLALTTPLITTIVFLAFASNSNAHAQALPMTTGSTVRVSRSDSTGNPFWDEGRVVIASRDSMLMSGSNGDALVRYNEILGLQIRRGERSMAGMGGGVGFLLGAVTGVKLLADAHEDPDRDPSLGPIIVRGAIGAAVGALIGGRIRIKRWDDVPLEDGRFAVAPLDESGTQTEFSLSRAVRWTRFEPTTANFQAFLAEYAASLHPAEGIWVRTGTQLGIAIVRVAGHEDTYAAYWIRYDVGPGDPATDGLMIFALTPGSSGETDWRFQIAQSSPRKYEATLESGVLMLRYPGGTVDQWERLFPD